MTDTIDTLLEQLHAYAVLEASRPLRGPETPTPQILQSLSDMDLDRLCDAVHDEGRRRGFGDWWYE